MPKMQEEVLQVKKFCKWKKAGKSRRQQCNMYKYAVQPGRVSGEFKPLQGVTPLPRSHRHINWKKRNTERDRGECPMLMNANLPYANVLCYWTPIYCMWMSCYWTPIYLMWMSCANECQLTLCKCPVLLNTNLPYVNVLCCWTPIYRIWIFYAT